MATHNQVRAVGFLKNDPKILNEGVEGAEKNIIHDPYAAQGA